MHVLFHMQTIGMSGGVKVTLDLAEHFVRAGHNVTLVLDEPPKNAIITTNLPTYVLNRDGSIDEVQINPYRAQSARPNFRANIGKFLKKRLSRYPLVHRFRWIMIETLHGRNISASAVRDWIEDLGIDFVVSTSIYSRQYIDKIFSQVRPVALSLHNDVFDISQRKNLNVSPHKLRRDLKNYAAVVCVSTAQEKRLLEFDPSLGPISTTIRNMVDAGRVAARAGEFAPSAPVDLIYVGSLVSRKRVDRILRALQTVPGRHLTIVGEGTELVSLQTLTKQLGLTDRVRFIGQVPNPLPYLKKANALILASEYEALPNVILEAFALHTPVIASDCETGPRELVAFGRSELLPNDDIGFVREFANRLLALDMWIPDESVFSVATEFSADKTVSAWSKILLASAEHA